MRNIGGHEHDAETPTSVWVLGYASADAVCAVVWEATVKRAFLALVLVLIASSAFAQGDDINVSTSRLYAGPGDTLFRPITCHITSVTFTDYGFPVNADCLDGPSRWPDVVPDGWEGPIQFTYGMCLRAADGHWACSPVVQMWYKRQEQDPNATAAPYAVAKSWFYDSRWGELQDRNPAPNELVGLFIVRGNARYGTEYTRPFERSNVVLVKWGQNWSSGTPVVTPPSPPPVPVPQPTPIPTSAPTPQPGPVLTPTIDLSAVLEQLKANYDQVERVYADLSAQNKAHDEHLTQHDTNPTWVGKVFGNRYTQIILGAFGTCMTTDACRARFGL